jgi:transposase InsO family protein
VWEIARSTVYAAQTRRAAPRVPQRRGPKGPWGDAALLAAIREVLDATSFVGEGHRKVWARLRSRGLRTSKARVLRLMREARLLAPTRPGRAHGPAAHDGTIVTDRPDVMWGTDATSAVTRDEGTATIFVAVDHCTAECLGVHAAKPGTRFEALEPLRQGVHASFGGYAGGVAAGLQVRHDHGSQYLSDAFQAELRFLGIASSPAFVREPQGNGCAERFIRTLKEQLLWLQTFDTVEALRLALLAFKDRYNREWLIERHGHQTPAARRAALTAAPVAIEPAA